VEVSGLQRAVQKLAEQAAETAKSEAAKPQQEDILKFQESMQQAPAGHDHVAQNQLAQGQSTLGDPLASQGGAAAEGATAPVEKTEGPGDTLLKGLEKMRNDYQSSWQQMQNIADGGKTSFDPQEMLRVQMEVQRTSLEVDLLGKVASKGTQDFNQLLKNQ